jgi:hypothetical protein
MTPPPSTYLPHLTLSVYLESPQSNNYCERCWDECETFFHDRFCARCTEVRHDDTTHISQSKRVGPASSDGLMCVMCMQRCGIGRLLKSQPSA